MFLPATKVKEKKIIILIQKVHMKGSKTHYIINQRHQDLFSISLTQKSLHKAWN